ncbi:MAG: hypothetical protein Q9187_001723 [Circinaria calcarea]
MPGIVELYVDAANRHISKHVSKYTTPEISRAKVDFLVLESLDKSDLDLEFKFAWYNTILHSDTFNSFWVGVKLTHRLRESAIRPYIPDASLMSYEALSEDEASSGHGMRGHSQDTSDENDGLEHVEEEADAEELDVQDASIKKGRASEDQRVRFANEGQQGDTDDGSYPARSTSKRKKNASGARSRKRGGKGAATRAPRKPTKKQAADAAGPSTT